MCKFTSFRPWKIELLTLLTVKENLYKNLLRTIISSLVNKKNYYFVHIIPVMIPLLPLRVLYFPFYVEVSLDSKSERIFSTKKKKKKFPKIFQSILCLMDKCNLLLSTSILLFDVLSILIHYFLLFFNISSQKKKFYVKRKNNTQSSCMVFFEILCRMDIYFKRLIIYQSGITMIINNT